MIALKLELGVAIAALAIGLASLGPRRAALELRDALLESSPAARRALVLAGVGLLALCAFAEGKVPPARYLASVAFSTLSFVGLWWASLRIEGGARLLRVLGEGPAWVPAVCVAVLALAAQQLVLGDIPHTSDEVAYQFQARAYAQGQLGFPPPDALRFFEFVHLTTDGGIWHGIMNPGWPLVLAPGMLVGLGFLVNPLLAALALPLFHGFLRRAGAGRLASGLSVWALAFSPFYVFMAASYMAHTAGFFALALFLWGWIRVWREGEWIGAAVAGAALALGVVIRPIDAAAFALPFGLALAWRAVRRPRWVPALLLLGALASTGAVGTLAYNRALTGDAFEFPQTRYFAKRFPGQGFGIGFGDSMGSRVHGDEWPGYHPGDAPRVTSHRMLHALRDAWGLPWLTAALLGLALFARQAPVPLRAVGAGALSLVLVYGAHFYHGLAYGSRHYFLALAAAALAWGGLLALALASEAATRRRAAAAGLAWVAHTLVFATPPLVREYGDAYRMASPSIRRAVARAGLDHALVFVSPEQWGWKSAFPLNELPLERSPVLFAQDLGADNVELRALHPDRSVWRVTRHRDDRASLEPLELDAESAPLPRSPDGGTR